MSALRYGFGLGIAAIAGLIVVAVSPDQPSQRSYERCLDKAADKAKGDARIFGTLVSETCHRLKPKDSDEAIHDLIYWQSTPPDLSKAPKWADVEAKPEFKSLSPEKQAQAKQAYFDYWIAPNVGKEAASLRERFLSHP